MPKALTKVIYKPDHTSNDEYTVIVNPEEVSRVIATTYPDLPESDLSAFCSSRNGRKECLIDTSIPLAEVVDSFSVYHSTQGHQGRLGQASKQQLDTDFNTNKDVDVITAILTKGKEQSSDSIGSLNSVTTNMARGSQNLKSGVRLS
ncbi:hypothetical protein H0H87_001714 [Tephrocybe sp. NHM501043]|nr:hypothetical protein H0H87_001714 [Tephrocybe sp. NHM501043]